MSVALTSVTPKATKAVKPAPPQPPTTRPSTPPSPPSGGPLRYTFKSSAYFFAEVIHVNTINMLVYVQNIRSFFELKFSVKGVS